MASSVWQGTSTGWKDGGRAGMAKGAGAGGTPKKGNGTPGRRQNLYHAPRVSLRRSPKLPPAQRMLENGLGLLLFAESLPDPRPIFPPESQLPLAPRLRKVGDGTGCRSANLFFSRARFRLHCARGYAIMASWRRYAQSTRSDCLPWASGLSLSCSGTS